MTISEWLINNMIKLQKAGVDSPRRDCLVLLEDTLNKDRAWVVAHPEQLVQGRTLHQLERLIQRRGGREPLAYIRGKAWFYGRFFEVNPHVLIPRPESEDFIDLLKQLVESRQLTVDRKEKMQVIDIGTGSGCLAITIKLELPFTEVIATDISTKALEVAENNAKNHKVDIKFVQSNLLNSVTESIQSSTIITANLPYVPKDLITSPEITTEPKVALFSGEDGLDHYRLFWQQISELKTKPKYVLTESLERQHKDLEILANTAGYKNTKTNTLTQVFKLLR
ncbi:MAG: peptide chain release factor N(5)-glutamine methyltransferase [Patescibacteria group bacterium]